MKKKRFLAIPLCALFILSAGLLGACGKEGDQGGNNPSEGQGTVTPPDNQGTTNPPDNNGDNMGDNQGEKPENKGSLVPTKAYEMPDKYMAEERTTSVSVHDPSIFKDPKSKTYYTFGSHYAAASSTDLITWKKEVGDNEFQKLYGNETITYATVSWPKAIESTVNLVKPSASINTTWAPDVEYYNGKYYMYYSLTKAFGSRESAIARVEADSPLGPYTNNTIILDSMGGKGDDPNCIDPELFYDKDGKLWMTYGSFFGGVYVKELNNSGENWGLPKDSENKWGTLIWRNGYAAGVEGPFIFYNELADYYYLMVSEGDLNTVYNMRFARSKNPNGPYEDVTGNDVATSAGKGNKVAGNYKFARQSGNGYAAMGHNSVVKKDGEYFVVYHARRVAGDSVTQMHYLHVSQLFFNEGAWPVMSPNFYVGEEFGTIPEADVAVDYEILVHNVKNEKTATGSENYTLVSDGTVKKGTAVLENSSWTMKQNYYIELTLSGVAYKGVVVPGWDSYSAKTKQKAVFGITAVSDTGLSLWGLSK